MKRTILLASCFLLLTSLTALLGCRSYTIVQQNVFADDDGNVLFLEYGRSDSDHVNTFVSPATGKEIEFKSKLMVRASFNDNVPDCLEILNRGMATNRVELADRTFIAWQCMNFFSRGTMYETDDGEWRLLANGFSVSVYHRMKDPPQRDLEVFRGVLCDTVDRKVKKDERWKSVPKGSGSSMGSVR